MSVWYDFMSILFPIELCMVDLHYAIISMNSSMNTLMGYLVFASKNDSNVTDMKHLLNMYDIYVCQDVMRLEQTILSIEMFRLMVLNNCNVYWEEGSYIKTDNKSVLPLHPIISTEQILNLFENSSSRVKSVLIVEESKRDLDISYGIARLVKEDGMLSFTEKGYISKIHIIHLSNIQCYHAFRFHQNPHYGLKLHCLPLLKWILKNNKVNFEEYKSEKRHHHNDFVTIHNNLFDNQFPLKEIYSLLKGRHLRTRNLSNFFISYGYSAMFRDLSTGEPLLTKAIHSVTGNRSKILPLVLPVLCNLSKDLKAYYPSIAPDKERNMLYAQMMGSNFKYSIDGINYFEGFDVSIMYEGDIIDPHCDVMNDWRNGYDFISVVKSTFLDDDIDRYVTLSIICYTRKAIGDYMYGAGVNKI